MRAGSKLVVGYDRSYSLSQEIDYFQTDSSSFIQVEWDDRPIIERVGVILAKCKEKAITLPVIDTHRRSLDLLQNPAEWIDLHISPNQGFGEVMICRSSLY
jgi:hypothetical protein